MQIAGQVAEMIFWKRGGNGRKSLLLMVTLPLTVFLVKVHSHYSNEVGDVPMIDVGDTAEQHRRMERIRSRCDEKRFEKIAQRIRSQSETDTPVFVTEPKNHIFYCQIPKVKKSEKCTKYCAVETVYVFVKYINRPRL